MSPSEPEGLRIVTSETRDQSACDLIHDQIKAFNNSVSEHHRAARMQKPAPLDYYVVNSQGQLMGGLTARTYWGWLELESLWIDETIRRSGYGRRLLNAVEAEAQSGVALARRCELSVFKREDFMKSKIIE